MKNIWFAIQRKKERIYAYGVLAIVVLVIVGFAWGATVLERNAQRENCQGKFATSACFTLKVKEAQVKEEFKARLQALKEENK